VVTTTTTTTTTSTTTTTGIPTCFGSTSCGVNVGDPCCAQPGSGLLFCCYGPCVSPGVCGHCGALDEACCPGNICEPGGLCCGGYCAEAPNCPPGLSPAAGEVACRSGGIAGFDMDGGRNSRKLRETGSS
jgi:hypothetical protein